MKIKTQFINSMFIFGIILLIIATSVIVTNQQVERLNTQEELAKDIERSASELGYLSNDYLLYHESQQRARWESKFSELSDDLSNLDPNSPEQQTLVNNIQVNQQRLKAVFTDIVSTFENVYQNQNDVIDPAFIQISWSRMAVQNQGMAFDAERLAQTLRNQANQSKQTNITLIFALLGIFGAYFFINYLIVYRRALKSISELQEGTRIIGSGNFDFVIKQKNNDEIGELSHAFSRMTANLKEVTASKAELEKEITERKRAEEKIEHLASFPQLNPNPIIEIDANGTVTFFNEATAEVLKKLEMEDDARIFLPGDFEEIMNVLGLEEERQLFYREVEVKDKIFAESIHVLKKLSAVRIYVHDITERKLAEEALRKAHDELEIRVQERTAELKEANKALLESETSYRDLTESIDDLFYAIDGDLRYTYWNKKSEAFTGILAKDAIGKSIYELFPGIKGTKMEHFYIETLKTQQPARFESEYQFGNKKFIFEISTYPTNNSLSVIAKDITENKTLELQLLRAQRMESIGTLAGGIAHDLNNVLTPIMLSLQMLTGKFKDEQSQKLLTILEKNSQRGADLIKQVLSFARGIEGERNPLQARHIITEIEKVAKETFPRNIEIRTDMPKDLFTIPGDATQLHQVIMNLCVNARDAMPDGGILSITASNFFIDENYARMNTEAKVGSYVAFSVSDTGIGIPTEILDRIFEPFFTTKEFGKGTGLGLSTVVAIVKSHDGFINVYSEVGKGTAFRVYLPAVKTEMQNIEKQQPELPTGHEELVLVAEDEDSIREVTISTLEKNGYKVITACDGVEAISSYAQNMMEIKVILMDMMMPVMDGLSSIRAIRRINPEVKIIAVSGLAEKEKLKNVADHTNAFLPKPYTAERLLKTIHEVINEK